MADTPSTFSVDTEAPEVQLSNKRSVMPTDVQTLTVPNEEYTFSSKKGRWYYKWSIPTDPEDPQSTPASPMGSSKAPFIT